MVPVKRVAFWGDVPNLVAQAPLVVFPHVHPVHQDLAFGGVVEPGDQVDHGALPQPVEPMMATVSPPRLAVKEMSLRTYSSASG